MLKLKKKGNQTFMLFMFGIVLLAFLIWKFFDTMPYGGNFSLRYDNKIWRFLDAPKKINLVYFGFTKCGDVCPVTMSKAADAYKSLSVSEQKQVQFIFVSVDAAHDSEQDAAGFASKFYPNFIGLSGSKFEIDDAIRHFPAGYIIQTGTDFHMGYKITHPDKFFILDQEGNYLGEINAPKTSEKIKNRIIQILKTDFN